MVRFPFGRGDWFPDVEFFRIPLNGFPTSEIRSLVAEMHLSSEVIMALLSEQINPPPKGLLCMCPLHIYMATHKAYTISKSLTVLIS